MTTRQRLFVQTGQVDTQWEMIGSPGPLPSSDTVNEYDTADALVYNAKNAGPGKADNEAFEPSPASGAPDGLLYQQDHQLVTSEYEDLPGSRYDAAVTQAYRGFTTTNLASAVNNAVTTLPVNSAAGFPASGNFVIYIDQEQLTVTAGQGTTSWTVTRAANGTTAAAHAANAVVRLV